MSNSKHLLKINAQLTSGKVAAAQEKLSLVQLVTKLVSYGIIGVSAILKVPQILKITQTRSVEGISKYLFYLDVISSAKKFS